MTLISTNIEGKRVKVGDYVGFKCDIEQCAKVISIKSHRSGRHLVTVKAPADGFEGEYIADQDTYTLMSDECWIP